MLVMRQLRSTELDAKELGAALRFKYGTADKADFDLLLDLVNMMLIAGSTSKQREYAIAYADNVALPALKGVQTRHTRTGKLGVTSEEARILVDITTFSKAFWDRQPLDLYNICAKELKLYYAQLAREREEKRHAERTI
jgi:hypothetical protein